MARAGGARRGGEVGERGVRHRSAASISRPRRCAQNDEAAAAQIGHRAVDLDEGMRVRRGRLSLLEGRRSLTHGMSPDCLCILYGNGRREAFVPWKIFN